MNWKNCSNVLVLWITMEEISVLKSAQEVLMQVWAEVLGLDVVQGTDNFFELGGDSLLCFQVIDRIQSHGYTFSFPQILEYQTINELAPFLEFYNSAELNNTLSIEEYKGKCQ
jgi:aryl carrier-like protein